MITWPLGWSDPSIGCTWSIPFLPCFLYVCLDMFFNFFFSFTYFCLGCLGLCWKIPAYMSSLQATETNSLVQPSTVVPIEMCSNAILGYVTILLKIVTTFPCIVVPIVMVYIVVPPYMLIWWPHRLWSTLKGSMSILLAIVAMLIKSLCPCDFSPAIFCQMSLHVGLVKIPLAFGCVLLINLSIIANINNMPFLLMVMTSRF